MTEMEDRGEQGLVSIDEFQELARRIQSDPEYAENFKQDPQGMLEAAGFANAFRAKVALDGSRAQRMAPIPELWCLRWGDTYVCIPCPPWF